MSGPEWRIRIKRSGGFAGVSLGGELRSDELSPEEAEELDRLASKADFASTGSDAQARPGQPDRFQYSLVVDHGSDHYELTSGEGSMDEPLRELVRWLMPRVTRRAST
jgi:emfourin